MQENEMKCGGRIMVCKYCGNEIDDHSEFCFVCGQNIASQPADDQADAAAAPDTSAQTGETLREADGAQPLPVAEPAAAEDYAAVDPKDVQKAGKFTRFVCFICPLIGAILYMVCAKKGETGKKHSVANATMSGVCFYLVIAILLVIRNSMF